MFPHTQAPRSSNKRAAEVLALGEIFSSFGGTSVAREVLARGGGAREFHDRIGTRMRGSSSFDKAMGCDFSQKDLSTYSLTNLVRNKCGIASTGGNEQEIATEIYRQSGVVNEGGTPIPWAILSRDFTASAPAEAGNLTEGGSRHSEFIRDPLRAALALGRLGATISPGFRSDFAIPRFSTDASTGYLSEVQAANESQPGTSLVTFSAKRVGGYVEVSKQALLFDSGVMENWLTRILRGIAFSQIESGAINGSGAGVNPLGIRLTPGVAGLAGGTNGALFDWSHVTGLENQAALAGAMESEFGGYLTNTKVRHRSKNTQRAAGLPFIWSDGDKPLNGYRAAITGNVPGNLTKGTSSGVCSSVIFSSDWSALLVPIFGAPDIVVDGKSLAHNGLVRIIINVWMASGVLVPANFAVMDDALTV